MCVKHINMKIMSSSVGEARRGSGKEESRQRSFESKDELAHFREEPTNVAAIQLCDRLCSATCRLMGTETRGNPRLTNMLRRRVENSS